MRVLIVEGDAGLAGLWKRHIEMSGAEVQIVATADAALARLGAEPANVIVLDLVLPEGSALAVADYASYRHPAARVVFVTSTSFFSDGSIFALSPNAHAFLQTDTPPEDLAAVVEYHGRAA